MEKLTQDQAVKRIKEIYGNKYDCSKVIYSGTKKKVIITCPVHGDFLITPEHIFRGMGCRLCGRTKRLTAEEFISKSEAVHGDAYDYSSVKYVNNRIKVEIICKKCGKRFMQAPLDHMQGKGCSFCSSSAGENKISSTLEKMNVEFESQHRFLGCSDKRSLPFDFYLPDYNTVIEYQGVQHYQKKSFGAEPEKADENYSACIRHDQIKRDYCKNNNIKEIEIGYKDFDNIEGILEESIILAHKS